MGIWLRRVSALAMISLGIALIFFPYNENRSGSVESEAVTLQREVLLNPDVIRTRFPGMEIVDITGPELNPDDYPDLWRVFINLNADWTNDSATMEEWNRFQKSVLQGQSINRLVVFREQLINCSSSNKQGTEADAQELALFTYLGRYNLDIKSLSEADLVDYPAILQFVKNLDAGENTNMESTAILKDEWDNMVDRYLDPLVDSQTFKFNGNFYGPEFDLNTEYIEGEVSGLLTVLRVMGIISLLIGVLLIRRLYFQKRGIMVNPRGIAILYDAIALLFAIPSAYMVVNIVLLKTMFILPFIDDDFGLFMGVFFFCFGVPVLALYTSRFTSQSIEIDSEGIRADSLLGKNSMTWESIESMDFADEYIVVGRGGMLMPRQLQKCLKLVGKTGESMSINEPQLKGVKQKIASTFKQYAPDHLRDRIKNLMAEW